MATAADRKRRSACSARPAIPARSSCACCCAIPQVEIALLTADRRAGQEMRQVFPQFSPFELPKLQSIEGMDWAGAGLDLIFCALAARHHAEGDQADPRTRCPRSRSSTSRPTSGCPTPPPMRTGTATSIMRRSCSRAPSTAWSRSIATRSGARSSSPIPAATPPAPSFRSFRCCGPKRSIPTPS